MAEVGASYTFKSQVPTIKSQVTTQTNQASQVKSVAHLKQVKLSPDKGQVKSSHSIKQEQIYFC